MLFIFYVAAFVVIFIIFFGVQSALYVFVPIFLLWYFVKVWFDYKRLDFLSRGYVLLEMVPSSDLTRRDIELFLSTLHRMKKNITHFEQYVQGAVNEPFSIEVVSGIAGTRCYIRTTDPEYVKERLASYSPQSVLREVEDYSHEVPRGVVAAEFLESFPAGRLSDLLTKGGTTWSQFTLHPSKDMCFNCSVRMVHVPEKIGNSYNKKVAESYRDLRCDHGSFTISPKELSQLFTL